MRQADGKQLLACALLMHAKKHGEKGVFRGDHEAAINAAFDECSDENTDCDWVLEAFEDALNTLVDCGMAARTTIPGSGDYFKISYVDLGPFLKEARREIVKYHQDSDEDVRLLGDMSSYPTASAYMRNGIFSQYQEFGDEWLRRSLLAFSKTHSAQGLTLSSPVTHPEVIESSLWTGLPQGFQLTAKKHQELVELLRVAELNLDAAGLTNDEKSLARAYIVAARSLADTADPPLDLIWEIINRANQISGIAALFVSIIGLFA